MTVSIIICTLNRAESLRRTLETLGKVRIPPDCEAELIVVDNGSTDNTAAVLRSAEQSKMAIKRVHEPRKGKSHSLNTGMAISRGEIILFTDDDVKISEDWVEQMLVLFAEAQCDAVVGRIELDPALHRPWLNVMHKRWLAAPDINSSEAPELIGANMGIRRSVLQKVPQFDPELGPGRLGLGEESLLGYQLAAAGFSIKLAEKAIVVHYPGESRLRRRKWLDMARKNGRQKAYIRYHWEHGDRAMPHLRWFWYGIKLWLRRILQPPPSLDSEGCQEWEMSYLQAIAHCKQLCVERRRPRNYSRRGLIKRVLQEEVIPDK